MKNKSISNNISNISIKSKTIDIKDKTIANLVSELLPTLPRYRFSFDCNYSACIANAIRRTLIEELSITFLNVDISNVITDDYAPNDFIADRIKLIPISQSLFTKEDDKLTASLSITNAGLTPLTIFSKDLIFQLNGNPIEWQKVCDGYFRIMVLEKGKYLKINNIQNIASFGYEEHGESTVIGNLIYKEINGIQDNEINRGGALKDQSLELHTPTGYHIEFDTIGNCDKMLMSLVCDNIINRLTKIKTYLMYKFDPKLNDVSANTKYADIYDFRLNLNTKELKIKGETHTIGAIITNYVFNIDPLIECIIYNANHPTMREITVRWRYNDDKIIIKGIDFAINDFNDIKKSFELYFK